MEDRAALNQFAAQFFGVCDVAVVRNRSTAHGKLAKEGLHIADRSRPFGASRRITHVPDRDWAGQRVHDGLAGEIIADVAKPAGRVEAVFRVMHHDAASLLAAVLQSVQPKSHEICGGGHAVHPEYPAFLFQLVVIKRRLAPGGLGQGRVGHGVSLIRRGHLRRGLGLWPRLVTPSRRLVRH